MLYNHWLISFVEYKSLNWRKKLGHKMLAATLGLNSQTWLIPCFSWLAVYFSLIWRDLQFVVEDPNLQSLQFETFWKLQIIFFHFVAWLVWSMVLLDQQYLGNAFAGVLTQSLLCVKAHQQLWWNIGAWSAVLHTSNFGWWKGKLYGIYRKDKNLCYQFYCR